MPTFNAAAFLPATLESVLSQSYPAVQIIVVDDGSTDETASVLARFADRITLVTLANSGGPARPRNEGVVRATGDFVAFFDSDDLMFPHKLALQMQVFASEPEVDVVCSNFCSIDVQGRELCGDYLEGYQDFRRDLVMSEMSDAGLLSGDKAFSHLLRSNFVGTSSVVCRLSALAAAGPFDEKMKNGDDIDMWRRLARRGARFAFVDQVLHAYRITPGGVTSRGARRIPAMIEGLEKQRQYCENEADRRHIRKRIRELYIGMGWALRREGDLDGALASYRAGAKLGWSFRVALGLMRTQLSVWLGRHKRDEG